MGTGKGRMRKVTEMERKCGRFTTLLCQSAVMGDNLLLTAVPQLAELVDGYMESANPAVLCSHSMGQSQNGQILPVHVLSKASEFAHAAGENSTKAAISGTQRKRKTGIKVQSVLHGRAWLCGVYRMCVTFALGLWSWEPKEALKCKSHTLEMVSWRRRGRWRGCHGQRLECCLGRMFSTGCYPRSCALHGESHSAWIFTGHVV